MNELSDIMKLNFFRFRITPKCLFEGIGGDMDLLLWASE